MQFSMTCLGRALRAAVLAAGCLSASGCGVFDYFEEEEILEGERIRLRDRTTRDATLAATLTAPPIPAPASNNAWTQTNGLPSHAAGHLNGPRALSLSWSKDVGAGSGDDARITSAPVAAGGLIFVMDADATVSALDLSSGAEKWSVDVSPEGEDGDEGFGGGIALGQNIIVVTTGFGEVLGLSPASGEILWRQALGAPIRSAPAVSGQTAVVVTRDNSAFGINVSDGTVIWRLQGVLAGAGFLGGASPAIAGPLAVLPFTSGELVGASVNTGRRAWSAILSGGRRGLARSAISDITGDPVIAGPIVVAANQSGRIVAIDGRSGSRIWTRSIGAVGPIWAAGETIYIMADDAKLMRLSLVTGDTLFSTQLAEYEDPEDREDPIAYSGPVLVGGQVLVSSSDGELISFDPLTGEERARHDIGDGSVTGPIVVNGWVYVLSDDGVLYAFR